MVAVLDANVLIPPGLRDMLLSCARGLSEETAIRGVEHALSQMRAAFPDACAETRLWAPLVGQMNCHEKDRHVLAVAVGTAATHLVTTNTRDFPVQSRPATVMVVTPDRFLRDQLARAPELVIEAVDGMSRRLKSPPQSPADIAELFAAGQTAPRFGRELAAQGAMTTRTLGAAAAHPSDAPPGDEHDQPAEHRDDLRRASRSVRQSAACGRRSTGHADERASRLRGSSM